MRNALALLLAVSLGACGGGGGGPSAPGNNTGPGPGTGTGNSQGNFSAVIDGQSWASTTSQTTGGGSGSNQVPGFISMTGTKIVSATNYTSISLTLGYIAGPGTYPLGVNQVTTAGGTGLVFAAQGGGSIGTWSTGFTGASGSVTVSSLAGGRITGTFQFTAPPQAFSSTTGTRAVTNGAFDLPLPAGFTPATATDVGSKVSARIDGAAWNAATVVALGDQGVFGITATTDSLSINITPNTALSAGNSFPIGGIGGGTMIVIRTGTSENWTSGSGAAVGSLTVTSFNGTRAAGTFSATLVPGSGTAAPLVITTGTFDVRVDAP